MDTDIEYNPQLDVQPKEEEEPPQSYYYPPMFHQQQPIVEQPKNPDVFANLDKTAYLIIFAAFILGFFMGKTMQPVILRHG
jgi:hypothetical protein